MKKLLFLCLFIASLSVSAQILGDKISNSPQYFKPLPGKFMTDNKSYILVLSEENENTSPSFSLKICDDELNPVKSINLRAQTNIKDGYEIRLRGEERVPEYGHTSRNSIYLADLVSGFPTDDEIIALLDTYWGYKVDFIDEDSVERGFKSFLSKEKCYNYEKYGYTYPSEYFQFYGDSLIIAHYKRDWDEWYFKSLYSGEWDTVDYTYNDQPNELETIDWYDLQGNSLYDDAELSITQTLFNTDDKYEYVRGIYQQTTDTYEEDRDDDGEVDMITTYYDSEMVGFEIVNTDGDVLQSISTKSPIVDCNFSLLTINDKCYWVLEDYYTSESYWYALNSGSNTGLTMVQTPFDMRVSPTMARRSQSITIETSDELKNRVVNIVDASGKSVWRQIIPAGQKSIRVNASKLSKGLNVVNVDGKKEQSVKVIVN